MIKRIVKKILPPGTIGFKVAQSAGRIVGVLPPAAKGDVAYEEWIKTTEPSLWIPSRSFQYEPLISIVVPVFNPPDDYLLPMVYSVVNQTYQNWELVLVNASSKPDRKQRTLDCANIDTRIRVMTVKNRGIAPNTNDGISACKGDYIALLDHDDLLSPYALSEVVAVLQTKQKPQFIYSDEDKLTEDGERRFDPHFKPAWSQYMLKGVNYLNHFTVIETSLLKKVRGYRTGFEGAQDYDLYLRIADENPQVVHVPKVLYHWREAKHSTARNFSAKKGITSAGERALLAQADRHKQTAKVAAIPNKPGFYRLTYVAPERVKATVVIFPTRDPGQQKKLLEMVVASAPHNQTIAEIMTPPTGDAALDERKDVTPLDASNGKQFLKKALGLAEGDVIVAVNAGVVPKDKDWIDQLVGLVAQNKMIGVASPMLVEAEGGLMLDAGFGMSDSGAMPLFEGMRPGTHTYFGNSDWPRSVLALSGRVWAATIATARKYQRTDERSLAYQDMIKNDLSVVFWPFVRLQYVGDLEVTDTASPFFSDRLRFDRGHIRLPRTIDLSVHRSDDHDQEE